MHSALQNFKQLYLTLAREPVSESLLRSAYRDDIRFIDPVHNICGITAMQQYFAGLYSNLNRCEFEFQHEIVQGDEAVLFWCMTYSHPKLRGGENIQVMGNSLLRFDQHGVYFHRDYVDMGAMLYEHVPLLGSAIRYLKRRMA